MKNQYKITKSQLDELQQAFQHYSGNSKTIRGTQLQKLFQKYEIKFSASEIRDIIQTNDYNSNGKLDFNEFVHILLFKLQDDLTKEYRMIFRSFDTNKDGKINAQELQMGMLMLGDDLSHKEIEELIADIDKDKNNLIDIEEFIAFIKDKNDDKQYQNFQLFFFKQKTNFQKFQKNIKNLNEQIMSNKILTREEKIQTLKTEFQDMDINKDGKSGRNLDKALVNVIYAQMDKTPDGNITQDEFIQAWMNAESSIQSKIEKNDDEIQKALLAMNENNKKIQEFKKQEQLSSKDPYALSTLTINVIEAQHINFEMCQAVFWFEKQIQTTNYADGPHPNFENYQIDFKKISPTDKIEVQVRDSDEQKKLNGILNLSNLNDQKIHQLYIPLSPDKQTQKLSGFGQFNQVQDNITPQLHLQVHYVYSKQKLIEEVNEKWKVYIDKYRQQNEKLNSDLQQMYTRIGFIETLKNKPGYYEEIKPNDQIALKSSFEPKFYQNNHKSRHFIFNIILIVAIILGLLAIMCMDYKHHILIDVSIAMFIISMFVFDFVDFTLVSLSISLVFLIISLAIEITWYCIYPKNWDNNIYIDEGLLVKFRRYEKYMSWFLMITKGILIILLIVGLFLVSRQNKAKSYSTGYNSKMKV